MKLLSNMKMCSVKVTLLFVIIFVSQTVRANNNSLNVEHEIFVPGFGDIMIIQPEYRDYSYMYLDSEYCERLNHCNNSDSYSARCSCDNLCGVLNDCCPGSDNSTRNITELDITMDQFSCHKERKMNRAMIVTKCPANWEDDTTRSLCETTPNIEDTLSRILVSHKTLDGYIFRNMHCALCNNVFDYQFWKAEFGCIRTTKNISECVLTLEKPNDKQLYRDCHLHTRTIISDCPENYTDVNTKQKCEKGATLLTYTADNSNLKFRNKYCAYCHGLTDRLLCAEINPSSDSDGGGDPDYSYSYRLLVDFNTKETFEDSMINRPGDRGGGNRRFKDCDADDQIYDPVVDFCRTIICPPNTQPSKGKCIPKVTSLRGVSLLSVNNTTETTEHCPLSKLTPNEFQFINTTNRILFRDKIYNDTEYMKNGSDVFLCINTSHVPTEGRQLQASDKVEQYLSFIGLILSIIALIVTIIVYFTFTELLNVPGKILVALCFSLLVSQLLFLFAPMASSSKGPCIFVAVFMHYSFLSAFSWMNAFAFDLLRTFSQMMTASQRERASSKKFLKYSIYCWGTPLVIVGIAVVLEFVVENDTFKPRYSEGVCWISSRSALLLFFVGPLALFKLFDVIAFTMIVYFITKAWKQGARAASKRNSRTFFIYLKLSLVMGLTWIFAFIANFSGNTIMWYLFIIFNTLQGLLIAISFICTKKVLLLVQSRYSDTKSKYFSSSTQSTQETQDT